MNRKRVVQVRQRVMGDPDPKRLWVAGDFRDLLEPGEDGRFVISAILRRMFNAGEIERLGHGVYQRPQPLPPFERELAERIFAFLRRRQFSYRAEALPGHGHPAQARALYLLEREGKVENIDDLGDYMATPDHQEEPFLDEPPVRRAPAAAAPAPVPAEEKPAPPPKRAARTPSPRPTRRAAETPAPPTQPAPIPTARRLTIADALCSLLSATPQTADALAVQLQDRFGAVDESTVRISLEKLARRGQAARVPAERRGSGIRMQWVAPGSPATLTAAPAPEPAPSPAPGSRPAPPHPKPPPPAAPEPEPAKPPPEPRVVVLRDAPPPPRPRDSVGTSDLRQALKALGTAGRTARQVQQYLNWRPARAEQALRELHALGCAQPGDAEGTYVPTGKPLPERGNAQHWHGRTGYANTSDSRRKT